jgi:glutamate transport system substrate-binding protein
MLIRRSAAIIAATVLALGAGACSHSNAKTAARAQQAPRQRTVVFPAGSTMEKLNKAQTIRVGTKFDQPLFGLKGLDGKPAGFDVEIAKLIVARLGIPTEKIEWVETPSKVREEVLEQSKVDMVVATYTINDARKQRVDFAGPYYVAGQQIMTRKGDNSITGPESLRDGVKKVCSATGSTPAKNIERYLKTKATQLVLFDGYDKCADALKTKQVDAVTTDNVILTGFVSQSPNDFQLVGTKFTQEPYGIGVKKGDDAFRGFVNDVLDNIEQGGQYTKAWQETVGKVDSTTPAAPAVDRY